MKTKAALGALILLLVAFALLPNAFSVNRLLTLDKVRQRGKLVCGVMLEAPGFAELRNGDTRDRDVYHGMDVDFCRALAAATLGDPRKVEFRSLTAVERFGVLQNGEIDLIGGDNTITFSREAKVRLSFPAVTVYDGNGLMVRKSSGALQGADLAGATVCATQGTTSEIVLGDWSRRLGIRVRPIYSDGGNATSTAFYAGRCDAWMDARTALAGSRIGQANPDDFVILDDTVSREPNSPAVRQEEAEWESIVRWTHYALLEAEVLEITKENVAEMKRSSQNFDVRNLLDSGMTNAGADLRLAPGWAAAAIAAVGNYAEIYDRNLGMGSAIKLPRGQNALWRDGGLMYPMPIR